MIRAGSVDRHRFPVFELVEIGIVVVLKTVLVFEEWIRLFGVVVPRKELNSPRIESMVRIRIPLLLQLISVPKIWVRFVSSKKRQAMNQVVFH